MARFRVQFEPGVQVPGLPFQRMGDEFEAPAADFVPSRALLPLDEEARVLLKKAKEAFVTDLERQLSEQEPPRKLAASKRAEFLRVPELAGPAPEEPKADETLTARQLEAQRAGTAPTQPPTPPAKGGRAADR